MFTRSGTNWAQQGEPLTGKGETGAGNFGESVAGSADGNTVLVGGPGDNGNYGAVWAFERNGGVWKAAGSKFVPKAGVGEPRIGESVTLAEEAGETVGDAVIGGPGDNGNIGAAWSFVYQSGGLFFFEEKLTGTGETGKAEFGARVALTAVGAEEGIALIGGAADNGSAGAAWAFHQHPEAGWEQKKLTAGAEEIGTGGFGGAVAISADGNTGLIAAPTIDSPHFGLGAVWAYNRSGETTWTQVGEKLTGTTEEGKGLFSVNTAISGDGKTALVGAFKDNEGKGAVWVFAAPDPNGTTRAIALPAVRKRSERRNSASRWRSRKTATRR